MKKTVSTLLAIAMCLCLVVPSFASTIDANAIEYRTFAASSSDFTISNGVLVKYNGAGGNVTIPNGVTKIGDGAFLACNRLTSVNIPTTVSEIGMQAFMASGLTSVTIPNSVKKIGREAFWSCGSLTSVTIGSSVIEMGGIAFEMCDNLKTVNILEGTTVIGSNAFRNCYNLTSVTIPSSVTEIGAGAFELRDGAIYVGAISGLTIHCAAGSYAETYAKQNNIRTQVSSTVVSTPNTGFIDVADNAFYAEPVKWAVGKGITNGTGVYTFSPNETCTKAQILTFIWRASGEPEPIRTNPFRDVQPSDYYYKAAIWAYEKGMVTGSSFVGNGYCTRGMAVTYLWNIAGSPAIAPTNQFSDVSAGSSYAQAVAWAVSSGITNGTGANTFSPSDICNRGQIVTFLYRCMVEPMAVTPVSPTPSAPSQPSWSTAYQDFVLNEKFLSVSYPYDFEAMSAWGNEQEHQVSVYDFDRDGTPELTISNGYSGRITDQCYVYTYVNGNIEYIGTARLSFSCIPGSTYSGVFCEWGFDYETHGVTYYRKSGNSLIRESVYTYSLANEHSKHMETSDAVLFSESQKQMTPVPCQSVSSIRQMGWDSFVQQVLN